MDNMYSSPGGQPPVSPPPPVIAAMPPPRPPSRGRGWMIIAVILVVLLVISIFWNFAQMATRSLRISGHSFQAANEAGPQVEEAMLKDNGSDNKIAVISVDGIITSQGSDVGGDNMVDVIKAEFDAAQKDDDVRAVILKVDSPGGEVMAADEIYRIIKRFQDDPKKGKPVICSMGGLAASGGYYISAPCRWIVANELTLTASIGVIMETVNYRGLMDKIGVEPYVFKSGTYKDMLSGMRETNEIPAGEHAMVQDLIDETYDKFKSVVSSGREAAHDKNKDEGRPLAADWTKYADGRVVSGSQALQLGLVDQLGDFQDAVDRAKKIAGIENANLVEYQEVSDFSNLLRLLGQSEVAPRGEVKLDLGVTAPKLEAGKFYFLYLPTAD